MIFEVSGKRIHKMVQAPPSRAQLLRQGESVADRRQTNKFQFEIVIS